MAREQYEEWKPGEWARSVVRIANDICGEMKAQGYDLTLRQLYYQFVARGYIENNQRMYDRLGNVVNRARLAGLMDWDFIEDRTRNLRSWNAFRTPGALIDLNQWQYGVDHWVGQQHRVEVWVEKEALVSVVQRAASATNVPFFACRGYVSQSELHSAAKRHLQHERRGAQVHVVHLGDHDPSGIDMTRDIEDRLRMFGTTSLVHRVALNRDQIDQYNPPPNPAKLTDSRAGGYIAEHGRSSWELDALEPRIIEELVTDEVWSWCDRDAWDAQAARQREGREQLAKVAQHWDAVAEYVEAL